jgi:hypothetical protein
MGITRNCSDFGSTSISGGNGGSGGSGAGGGVLIKAPDVIITGTVDSRGGGNNLVNSGTVKIFYSGAPPSTAGISSNNIRLLPF